MQRATTGFSLVEVLVGLTIVVTLTAVLTPNLVSMLDKARVDRAIASLENLVEAIGEFEDDVNRYPSRLSHLAEPIDSDERDVCGDDYPYGLTKQWAGPYVSRLIPSGGVPIAIGTVRNEIVRSGGSRGTLLRLVVPQVTEEDALEVNARVDGDASGTDNTVQWTEPDEQGFVTLSFVVPVRGC